MDAENEVEEKKRSVFSCRFLSSKGFRWAFFILSSPLAAGPRGANAEKESTAWPISRCTAHEPTGSARCHLRKRKPRPRTRETKQKRKNQKKMKPFPRTERGNPQAVPQSKLKIPVGSPWRLPLSRMKTNLLLPIFHEDRGQSPGQKCGDGPRYVGWACVG